MIRRQKTRKQFIEEKSRVAKSFPVALATINFFADGNLGFCIRSAACFGASEVLVVGSIPEYRRLRQFSAGTQDSVTIKQFSNPAGLMSYLREEGYHIVSLELCDNSTSIFNYTFPKDRPVCIVTGNETTGVPGEIILNSDPVYIPMPGSGKCLNTSQAAHVALYEWLRQNS